VGGTSLSAPLIAAVYALAGNGTSTTHGSYPYSHSGSLYDVTSGSNGSCGGSYLCTAGPGYDGPTGLGTPNGTGAF
jgi:subtilase family serine protease